MFQLLLESVALQNVDDAQEEQKTLALGVPRRNPARPVATRHARQPLAAGPNKRPDELLTARRLLRRWAHSQPGCSRAPWNGPPTFGG